MRTLRPVVVSLALSLSAWAGFAWLFGVQEDDFGIGTLMLAVGGGVAGGLLWNRPDAG